MHLNDELNPYAKKFRDAILDRSALTDELTDDEAEPFINWAMTQADRVGVMVENEDDAEVKLRSLMRFLSNMTKVVSRRGEYDDDTFI